MNFGTKIPETTLIALERRSTRLSSLIEVATKNSRERALRVNGAQLVERLGEWVEEIRDLREVGDEEVVDVIRSFELRLKLAEARIKDWNIPPAVRKQALGGNNGTSRNVRKPTRRRRKNAA